VRDRPVLWGTGDGGEALGRETREFSGRHHHDNERDAEPRVSFFANRYEPLCTELLIRHVLRTSALRISEKFGTRKTSSRMSPVDPGKEGQHPLAQERGGVCVVGG
jgi:hypothetical protein